MTPDEAVSEPLAAPGVSVQGLEAQPPLRLGEALSFTPEPLRGHVRVEATHPTVFLGPVGIAMLRDWLVGSQANPEDGAELELWTASGIAQETGAARRTVYKWIERDDFPRSFAHPVGGAPVWEADRVRAWLLTDRPRHRGPKAS